MHEPFKATIMVIYSPGGPGEPTFRARKLRATPLR